MNNNFTIQNSGYEYVISLLLNKLDSFAVSPEFTQLDEDETKLPGIVLSAFTSYLVRLENYANIDETPEEIKNEINNCYKVIEELANSEDAGILNLIVTEIFENIETDNDILKCIIAHLGEKSQKLYKKWM